MKSHEYARRLLEMAAVLLERPEFETNMRPHAYQGYWDKDKFLAAARALGAGKKTFSAGELHFTPDAIPEMYISIARDKVCKKVQEEKWECEPMLSAGEEKELIVGEADGIPF